MQQQAIVAFDPKSRILWISLINGERSSVGRASDCGSEGRGFETHRSPQKIRIFGCRSFKNRLPYRQIFHILVTDAVGKMLASHRKKTIFFGIPAI